VIEEAAGELVVESDEGCTIALDPAIDEALRLEGLARELVNRIQRLRKESGLAVSDRIRAGHLRRRRGRAARRGGARRLHRAETLAVDLATDRRRTRAGGSAVQDVDLDGRGGMDRRAPRLRSDRWTV
jgi:hypothetical protein